MIDYPIGTPEARAAAGLDIPAPYVDINGYEQPYQIAGKGPEQLHTGADFLRNQRLFHTSHGEPILACNSGPITYNGPGLGKSWGRVIVQKCDEGFYARYAHSDSKLFKSPPAGVRVEAGDQIAAIGTADGYYSEEWAHLHFDISLTDILLKNPSHWPGANRGLLEQHYTDPIAFIQSRKRGAVLTPETLEIVQVMTTTPLRLRADPSTSAPILLVLSAYTKVSVYNAPTGDGWLELAPHGSGWVYAAYTTPIYRRTLYVKTEVNVRAGPSVTNALLGTLAPDTEIAAWHGSEHNNYVMTEPRGWVNMNFLKATPPAPTVPPVTPPVISSPNTEGGLVIPPTACRIGVHIGSNPDKAALVGMAARLAAAGKPLAVAVAITDDDLANQLAAYTKVVYRMVWDGNERYHGSMLDGLTPEQAEQVGYNFYYGVHYVYTRRAKLAHYLKLTNETGWHYLDGYFNRGLMRAGDADKADNPAGRKLAIFGDSMSTPTPEQWQARLPALEYAKAHGHAVALNQYGAYVNGAPGAVGVGDDNGYADYGAHPMTLYNSVPESARPLLIITETGQSDSTRYRSAEFVVKDAAAYDSKLRAVPYCLGFAYFTAASWYGNPNASIDHALPDLEKLVMRS